MFDHLSQASLFLYILSLVTSLITLFSLGHVTTLALRLREQYIAANANEKSPGSMVQASEEGYHLNPSKWRLTSSSSSNEGDSLPISMNCVNMRLVNIALSTTLDQKIRPVRTPPPSPLALSPMAHQQMFYQPRPLSMAKLIMSRHVTQAQRKPPRRSPRSPPNSPPATSLRHHMMDMVQTTTVPVS